MKTLALTYLSITLIILITPVQASVTMQATINQNIQVTFNFENLNSTIYNQAKQTFNIATIPGIIVKNLEQQDLTHVQWGYDQDIIFNDPTNSITVAFYLAGSDIIDIILNKTSMTRIHNIQTEWRKFQVNLTQNFQIDFAEHFSRPIYLWNYNDSEKTYYREETGPDSLDLSCKFVLPPTATNIHATMDTIIFETPPLLGDVLLNSPFLILGALIIVIMVTFLFQRVRKK